jgi:hypothetical protein
MRHWGTASGRWCIIFCCASIRSFARSVLILLSSLAKFFKSRFSFLRCKNNSVLRFAEGVFEIFFREGVLILFLLF